MRLTIALIRIETLNDHFSDFIMTTLIVCSRLQISLRLLKQLNDHIVYTVI